MDTFKVWLIALMIPFAVVFVCLFFISREGKP